MSVFLRDEVALRVEGWIEALLVLAVRLSAPRGGRSGHVLVAGPGAGSIGDEAMYQAFVRNVSGPVVVVARRPSDLLLRLEREGLDYVFLPNLLYGNSLRRIRQLWSFLRLAQRSETVSVIGADTMDGVYNVPSSVRRFRTARQAAIVGVEARILGFSWNATPNRSALAAMRRGAGRVRYLVRDPESWRRIRADGAPGAVQVADLAFLTEAGTERSEAEDWVRVERSAGRRVVAVNANAHLERNYPDQLQAYATLIAEGIGSGLSFVLVPHDGGGARSDLVYSAELESRLAGLSHVYRIDRLLQPGQLVRLAALADVAISGRMHFAILCSVGETPSLTLSYQGKVRGMYDLLGVGAAVTSETPVIEQLTVGVASLLADESAPGVLRESVRSIRALSALNLPTPMPAAATTPSSEGGVRS